jgi:hypothetical protein
LAISKLEIFLTYDFGIINQLEKYNKNAKYIAKIAWFALFYLVKLKNLQLLLGSLLNKIILSASCEIS